MAINNDRWRLDAHFCVKIKMFNYYPLKIFATFFSSAEYFNVLSRVGISIILWATIQILGHCFSRIFLVFILINGGVHFIR